MNNSIFSFVETFSSDLAKLALQIEAQLFEDYQAALIQARLYSEQFGKMIAQKEEIDEPYPIKHVERIQKLFRKGVLDEELFYKFEFIRKKGNVAAHVVTEIDVLDVIKAHKYLFEMSVWFMQVYVDYTYEPEKYKLPVQVKNDHSQIEALVKPFMDQTLQKMDDLKNSFQLQLEKQRTGNHRRSVNSTTVSFQRKNEIHNNLIKLDFYLTNETTKALEYEQKESKEVIYVLPQKEITVVLNPLTIKDSLKCENNKRFNTSFRKFPKEVNKGKNPNHFGYMFKFKNEQQFLTFLQENFVTVRSN